MGKAARARRAQQLPGAEASDDCCDNACDVEPLWGVWGGGLGAFGTVAGDSNVTASPTTSAASSAASTAVSRRSFRAGVSTGFNAASLYTKGMPGYGTSNTLQSSLYGEYLQDAFYLDALAGYAHSDNRQTRPIVIPGLPFRSAQGYTTANTFFGQLEAGYKLLVAPSHRRLRHAVRAAAGLDLDPERLHGNRRQFARPHVAAADHAVAAHRYWAPSSVPRSTRRGARRSIWRCGWAGATSMPICPGR